MNHLHLLKHFTGQQNILTTHRVLIEFTGSHSCGLLLSQMMYWSGRSQLEEGWVAKTYSEWQDEVLIPERTCRRLVSAFEKQGLIETKVMKFMGNPTLHFRVMDDALAEALVDFIKHGKRPPLPDGSGHGGRADAATVAGTMRPPWPGEPGHDGRNLYKVQNLHTEPTTEPTHRNPPAAGAADPGGSPSSKNSKKKKEDGERGPAAAAQKPMLEAYEEFIRGRGQEPHYDGKTWKAFKEARHMLEARALKRLAEDQVLNPDPVAEISGMWKEILDAWPALPPFHQRRITLYQISVDLPNIIEFLLNHEPAARNQGARKHGALPFDDPGLSPELESEILRRNFESYRGIKRD